MFKKILATGAVLVVLPFTTPSFALKGIEALDQCVKTPGCQVVGHRDGSILILASEVVQCQTLEAECTVLKKVSSSQPKKREYQVPESLTASGGGSGDTGVPGTGSSSGGSGHTFGTSGPGRGPITTHDIQ